MTKTAYDKIEKFFISHRKFLKTLKILYKYIPLIVFIAYPVMLIILLFQYGIFSTEFLKVLLVPFCTFIAVTLLRYYLNFQRPYEKYQINPLIIKLTKGQSFPSRHSTSIFIIAMANLYINVYIGIVFLTLGIIICITRVIAGVHFIKDVITGALFSIFIGIVFFFMI